jgi:NifU-like protein
MGAEALQVAVFDWAKKRNVNLNALGIDIHTDEQEEGRIVCKCFTLTEPYIKRKIRELNLHTIPEITSTIKAGGACMSCQHSPGGLQDLLDEVWGKKKEPPHSTLPNALPILNNNLHNDLRSDLPSDLHRDLHTVGSAAPPVSGSDSASLSPFQFAKKIEKLLKEYLRPMLQKDGGDLELIDIKDTTIYLELRGTCAGCAGAGQTLKHLIERTLKEQIDERIRVIQV